MDNKVTKWLFETAAIRVCPENKPFWYTSGRIGPFYVNTHFLYGSESKAVDLLSHIDGMMVDKAACSAKMEALVLHNLETDAVFAGVMDALVEKASTELNLEEVDGISGGERRDWFFSLALAHRLEKPHLTLFKDMTGMLYLGAGLTAKPGLFAPGTAPAPGNSVAADFLPGMRFLHVADLITTASSYERAWVPAIRHLGAEMPWSLVVVDRLQGGAETLERLGVQSLALTEIRSDLFETAVNAGVLEPGRLPMVLDYMADPEGTMGRFVREHPEFLSDALAGDEKMAARARLCVQSGFYPLGE